MCLFHSASYDVFEVSITISGYVAQGIFSGGKPIVIFITPTVQIFNSNTANNNAKVV